MERRDLLKRLEKMAKEQGATFSTSEGGRHTIVHIGDYKTVVPRHREINEMLARAIIKEAQNHGN